MIVVAIGAAAQVPVAKRGSLLQPISVKTPVLSIFSANHPFSPVGTQVKPLPVITANFYAGNLGFFCKQEIKLDKVTKIPFRFRLGSVNDCDRLEGKRNTAIQ